MEEKKETRGGRREGAGRPRGIKVRYMPVNTKVPEEYAEKLRILTKRNNISYGQILKNYVDENWDSSFTESKEM